MRKEVLLLKVKFMEQSISPAGILDTQKAPLHTMIF